MSIKSAGAKQRRIKNVRSVGRRNDDYGVAALEAIHLTENLIESLLAFVMASAKSRAALASDGVDLVDENDRRSLSFSRREQVANTTGSHTDKHLDKFTTVDAEERHARFTGNRSGQQCLSRSRRSDQQSTLGHTATKFLELGWVLKEFNDLSEVGFDAFESSDVFERDRLFGGLILFGRAAREIRKESSAPHHLALRFPER